ncbi:Smr domain protein [Penaeus vannamei]|uniref:Smr domain protein n=1 Tax=Penaeus vannamei TaxID=6689 RepID=A0A423T6V9_PENVA|nr:Smr domain protein [Penaeus vannamei]
MSRFLRRLFCCCFPEVDDDAERTLTHGTSVDRRPTTIFGSSSNTLTLPYTSRADALTLPYTSRADALTLPYTSRADALTLPYTSRADALTLLILVQGPEISSQTLLNRETLQSKYTGHPALNLHFGFRDLEDIIQHRSRPVLDLHGMTVREAKVWVEFFLHLHQQSGTKVIEVVTGRGNNSADGKPKIKPAVEELLDDLELQFREMHKGGIVHDDLPEHRLGTETVQASSSDYSSEAVSVFPKEVICPIQSSPCPHSLKVEGWDAVDLVLYYMTYPTALRECRVPYGRELYNVRLQKD